MTCTLEIESRGERFTIACARCGAADDYDFRDRAHGVELVWWASFRCDACGFAHEADGKGSLPADLRALVIARFGRWGVEITSGGSTTVLKVARETLGLEMHELLELKTALPGPLFVGTEAEASRMGAALTRADVGCRVVHLDATGP